MEAKMLNTPHFKTAQNGTLSGLEKELLKNRTKIEAWFNACWLKFPPPLTSSVDLRNAHFKISVVDTNLFPAGYNNLNPHSFTFCIDALKTTMHQYHPHCKKILLLAENHTRNTHYYQSIAILAEFFAKAGFEVKISQLIEENQAKSVLLQEGNELILSPLTKHQNRLYVADFNPCLIVLNNDLSSGIPAFLEGIQQNIEPSPQLGWVTRHKTTHFNYYREVCEELAELIELDPWQICPLYMDCPDVNFMEREGFDALEEKTASLLNAIQKKYDEYGILEKPFVVVKADAGTYGMAVMTIQDPSEYQMLNRKQRMNMATSKGSKVVNQVILQEGIPTIERLGPEHLTAEPVVYMLGQYVIGGFYRVHPERNAKENLNSPGMFFEKLEFESCCLEESNRLKAHEFENQFLAYSIIARLGLLASAKEKAALK